MHLYQTDERIGVILINEVLTHLYAVHQLVKYFSNIWTLWTIGDWSLYTTIIERKCSSIKCFLESFIIKIKPVCKVLQGVRKCLYYYVLFCILVDRLNSMYSNTVTVQWLCTCLKQIHAYIEDRVIPLNFKTNHLLIRNDKLHL